MASVLWDAVVWAGVPLLLGRSDVGTLLTAARFHAVTRASDRHDAGVPDQNRFEAWHVAHPVAAFWIIGFTIVVVPAVVLGVVLHLFLGILWFLLAGVMWGILMLGRG